MREVGLHLRVTTNMIDLYNRAVQLGLASFQCFFIHQDSGHFYKLSAQELHDCNARNNKFKHRYLHGSYWINLAAPLAHRQRAFKAELEQALQLGFTHFILHPGSAKGSPDKIEAIRRLAKIIDAIGAMNLPIKLVLENVAHGGRAIGGDLLDFKLLKEYVKNPQQLFFCIDTAHAFSYGYDIATHLGQTSFIQLIKDTIGIDSIALIHLNDICEKLGSKIDRHSFIGQGNIGIDALKSLVMHPDLVAIPVLMELPQAGENEEQDMLALVRSWHTDITQKEK